MPKSNPTVRLGGSGRGATGDETPTRDESEAPMRTVPLGPERLALGRTAPVDSAETPREGDFDPDNADRLIGRIIAGRYAVQHVLGRGGMGIVYQGRHITIDRPVAIKVLRHDLARSTGAVQRFHREAKAAASIGSEHIVEVFDFGYSDEGDAYIAMELLAGEDLGRLIRREGPLPETRVLNIARQIARALEIAHSKGIIHRDLKSENIFVAPRDGSDFIKLLDFGISKVSEGDEERGPMTTEGVVMGTPHYMAPEQAMSALEADHRIDIYALGCLMYEMLTGRVPFTGKNPVEVVFKHVHEPPVPPSRLRPDLSPELEAVVMKALAKDRDQRYASATEVLAALTARRTLSLPDVRESTLSANTVDSAVRTRTVPPDANRKGPGVRAPAAIVAVAAILAAGAVFSYRGSAGRASSTQSNERVAPARDAGGALVPTSTAVPQIDRDAGSVATAAIDAAAPVQRVMLEVVARPQGAVIQIDGEELGHGHARLAVPRGSAHRVRLSAPGYASVEVSVVADGAAPSVFSLQPSSASNARVLHDSGVSTTTASTTPPNPSGDRTDGEANTATQPYSNERVDTLHTNYPYANPEH